MKRVLIAGLLLLSLVGLFRLARGPVASDDPGDDTLFFDRLWLDRAPTSVEDRLQVLMVMAKAPPGLSGRKLGSFVTGTIWQGAWVNFVHDSDGSGRLKLRFPPTGKEEKVRFRARRCEEPGFDLCLELHGASHGVRRYFSRHNWKVKPRAAEVSPASELERLLRLAMPL